MVGGPVCNTKYIVFLEGFGDTIMLCVRRRIYTQCRSACLVLRCETHTDEVMSTTRNTRQPSDCAGKSSLQYSRTLNLVLMFRNILDSSEMIFLPPGHQSIGDPTV